MIITPGELAVGQFVTVIECEKESGGDDLMSIFGRSKKSDYAWMEGIPLMVKAVDLPFVVCVYQKTNNGSIFGNGSSMSVGLTVLDTRLCQLKELKQEYVEAFLTGVTDKTERLLPAKVTE